MAITKKTELIIRQSDLRNEDFIDSLDTWLKMGAQVVLKPDVDLYADEDKKILIEKAQTEPTAIEVASGLENIVDEDGNAIYTEVVEHEIKIDGEVIEEGDF